jgi:hypothetical protein
VTGVASDVAVAVAVVVAAGVATAGEGAVAVAAGVATADEEAVVVAAGVATAGEEAAAVAVCGDCSVSLVAVCAAGPSGATGVDAEGSSLVVARCSRG